MKSSTLLTVFAGFLAVGGASPIRSFDAGTSAHQDVARDGLNLERTDEVSSDGRENIDVADGFKFRIRDNDNNGDGDNVVVGDGFRLRQREEYAAEGDDQIDVADGF